ncbi:MAG: DUF1501 domain-containing protein [Pirellulaceae bacterium]|nr:DUF1501 domain-containing protein [Pirellulaceae bacterium]
MTLIPNLPIDTEKAIRDRRLFFRRSGLSLGSVALGSLLQQSMEAANNPLSARSGHFPARAKSVIYLHMIGAPSQLDLFDPKPDLVKHHNEVCPESFLEGRRFAFIGGELRLAGSQSTFAKHGQSGHSISSKLPFLSKVADDLCFVHSLHTEEINHAPAQIFLHTGFGRGGRPSFGSWVSYGLGSENQDLPAYVVLQSGPASGAGSSTYSSGFLPSVHQGIPFRSEGDSVLYLSNPKDHPAESRRRVLDAVGSLNQVHLADVGDPEIATRINQYEMAYRMQSSVPELMKIDDETTDTLELYGAKPGKASFANNCLLARRLVERGVRIVELYDSDWDHHGNIDKRLSAKCLDVDQAAAALITDLKQRGLLDDTLVIWGSEFGRTPLAQGSDGTGKKTEIGRDHHKDAFTVWLAGGGIQGGVSYGSTDEFGFSVTENPVHVHDLNATVLHLLGLDHERLTFKYQGREFRLTDVSGHVMTDWFA